MQCGEFATAVNLEQDSTETSVYEFKTEQHLSEFDLQNFLDIGYRDSKELIQELDQARSAVNRNELEPGKIN